MAVYGTFVFFETPTRVCISSWTHRYIWLFISVLFASFYVKFVRQCQDSKRFVALLCVAVPKQSSLSNKSLSKDVLSYRTSKAKDIQ